MRRKGRIKTGDAMWPSSSLPLPSFIFRAQFPAGRPTLQLFSSGGMGSLSSSGLGGEMGRRKREGTRPADRPHSGRPGPWGHQRRVAGSYKESWDNLKCVLHAQATKGLCTVRIYLLLKIPTCHNINFKGNLSEPPESVHFPGAQIHLKELYHYFNVQKSP